MAKKYETGLSRQVSILKTIRWLLLSLCLFPPFQVFIFLLPQVVWGGFLAFTVSKHKWGKKEKIFS